MEDVFKRMLNQWSLEIAQSSMAIDRETIKQQLSEMSGDELRAMIAKGLRENFIPEDPNSTPYGIDDLPDFMQWLSDRFGLPTAPTRQGRE